MKWTRIICESSEKFAVGLTKDEVLDILDSVDTSQNTRYNRNNFMKYLKYGTGKEVYCGLIDAEGNCTALSVVETGNPKSGYCFLLEVQSFDKGAGSRLIQNLIGKYRRLWLMADPSADENLVGYYRRPEFGFSEYVVDKSGYGGALHVFYTSACDSELIEATSDENWSK